MATMLSRKRFAPIILFFFAACSSMQDFNHARQLVQERKLYSAIEHYFSFVSKHPQHPRSPEALFEIGKIQEMMGELDKAIQTYRKLVSSYPINSYTIRAQRRVADIFKNNFSNYRQALLEYDKLIQAAPNHKDAPDVQFEIADCYTLLHQFDQADLEYGLLIERYPNFDRMEEVFVKKANNAYIGANYENAIQDYRRALERNPDSKYRIDTLFGLASSYDELDDFTRAENYYRQVIDLYPSRKVVEIRLEGLKKRREKKKINKRDTTL